MLLSLIFFVVVVPCWKRDSDSNECADSDFSSIDFPVTFFLLPTRHVLPFQSLPASTSSASLAETPALQISLDATDLAMLQRAERNTQRERYEALKRSERARSILEKADKALVRTCRRKAPSSDQASAKRASLRARRNHGSADTALQLSRDNLKDTQGRMSLARLCHEVRMPVADISNCTLTGSPFIVRRELSRAFGFLKFTEWAVGLDRNSANDQVVRTWCHRHRHPLTVYFKPRFHT